MTSTGLSFLKYTEKGLDSIILRFHASLRYDYYENSGTLLLINLSDFYHLQTIKHTDKWKSFSPQQLRPPACLSFFHNNTAPSVSIDCQHLIKAHVSLIGLPGTQSSIRLGDNLQLRHISAAISKLLFCAPASYSNGGGRGKQNCPLLMTFSIDFLQKLNNSIVLHCLQFSFLPTTLALQGIKNRRGQMLQNHSW